MCGFAGFLSPSTPLDEQGLLSVASRMAGTLAHRGPDDRGAWADPHEGIALAHCRLSIIDLSAEGHQPMISADGRYVIAFNGEAYNFRGLRDELCVAGHSFRGHSDTEVLLAAVVEWGVQEALKRIQGMLAFVLWDRRERALYLARDRVGKKPLYFGWADRTMLFGSELKSLRAYPGFTPEIDRDALALYLRHGYVPSPHSIYRRVFKLPPGTLLRVPGDAGPEELDSWEALLEHATPYWSAREAAETGIAGPFQGSEAEAVDTLDTLLRDAVRDRLVSDVPLGAFLSGGIDSSTVVALMQAQSSRPVRTFSIGFHEPAYNEAEHALAVARHLGTDHTELYVTPDEAMAAIPDLPHIYDEPFADSSQIPTFLVARLARREVTVALSGDGGDELFGGYPRYELGPAIWRRIGWLPRSVRRAIAEALTRVSPQAWTSILSALEPLLPRQTRQRVSGDRIHKLAGVIAVESPERMYHNLVSHWREPSRVVLGSREAPSVLTDHTRWANLPNFTDRMMFLDLVSYLPDDILVKVDRASMAVSLEARTPLLDHRVVEFAWRLPFSMKFRNGGSKWLLRQVLNRYVPRELIERPKMGFGIPIDDWLRGPLRDWAKSLLDTDRLRREGFFDPVPIRTKWSEHISGERNWQHYLWDILMFQAWLAAQ